MEKRNKINQPLCFKAFFHVIRYRNAKMHAKHTIWRKEIFPETYPFTVYEHVRCQEAKNQGKHPIGENRRLQKFFISVLMIYLHT